MAAGLLAQAIHAIAKRVAVDAEPLRSLAPAAARVEESREGAD